MKDQEVFHCFVLICKAIAAGILYQPGHQTSDKFFLVSHIRQLSDCSAAVSDNEYQEKMTRKTSDIDSEGIRQEMCADGVKKERKNLSVYTTSHFG